MDDEQRSDVHVAAVLAQECHGIFGEMMQIHHPQRQTAILQPLPAMTQIAELDPLVARCGAVVIVGWIAPQQ